MNVILRVLVEAKKYWVYLFVSVLTIFGVTFAQLYAPLVVRELTALVTNNDPDLTAKSAKMAFTLAIVYLVQCVLQGLRSYLTHFAAWNFVADIRSTLYNHYQKLSLKFYHDKQTGQLMSRIISDTQGLELLIAHAVPDLFANILIFAGVSIVLFFINIPLALMSLIVIPFLIVSSIWFDKKVRPQFRARQKYIGDLNAVLQDNLSGMKEIQIFNQQELESKNVLSASVAHAQSTLKALKLSAIYHPLISFFSSMGTVAVIGYGGYLAFNGRIPIQDIIAFLMYLGIFYQPITTLSRINEEIQDARSGAERIFEILDTESDVKEKPHAQKLGKLAGKIEYQNVSFHYNDNINVLKDINLKINPGEIVALVGPTGVGKTTMISLLNRFYDTVHGNILVDDINIKDVTLESLRDNISVVLQDIFLFNGTVAQNIAYGKKNSTMDEIITAAKAAHAHEFIETLENGYDTYIGERGIKLSGGQKQRLSIARAILRDKPILILDEATAAVDVETEKMIHDAMDKVMENRTTIIIAHRLSTVKKADKIVVLEDGSIREMGTHADLLELDGLYARLNNVQIV